MSIVQKNSPSSPQSRGPQFIPVTRKPAATPQSAAATPAPPTHIRLAGNGGVMIVGPLSAGPLTPYLPAGVAATSNVKGR
jgi:hypothetical protein